MDELQRARKMYETRYKVDWKDRSYMWHPRNPIAYVHTQILDRQIIQAINQLNIELTDQRILDVGSGYGRLLRFWAEMGAAPSNLFGIDLAFYRLQHARGLLQRAGYAYSSAGELPFPDHTFDVTSQFSAFSSIFDHVLRRKAAAEMVRVLRPAGWLIWYDVSYSKGESPQAITRSDVLALFPGLKLKYSAPIFSRELSRVIKINIDLAYIWERLPFILKNGLVMVFRCPD
jgi:ubiquinone/menaquinone biosynthesis C-methylase UbiE